MTSQTDVRGGAVDCCDVTDSSKRRSADCCDVTRLYCCYLGDKVDITMSEAVLSAAATGLENYNNRHLHIHGRVKVTLICLGCFSEIFQ